MMLTVPGGVSSLIAARLAASGGGSGTATTTTAPAASALAALVEERKGDLRSAAQAAIHAFAVPLGMLAQSGASSDIRTKAMVAIKQVYYIIL